MRKDQDGDVWVIVFNENKDIWHGRIEGGMPKTLPTEIVLYEARHVTRYAGTQRGIAGCAVRGPNGDCRIEPALEEILIGRIHQILKCVSTPEVLAAWRNEPWLK
jgi:hypothetical protein